MDENTRQLLEQVGTQLRGDIQHLYEVLRYQAILSAVSHIGTLIILSIGLYIQYRLYPGMCAWSRRIQDSSYVFDDDLVATLLWAVYAVFFCLNLIFVGVFVAGLPDVLVRVLNPEYWAINQLLSALKGD